MLKTLLSLAALTSLSIANAQDAAAAQQGSMTSTLILLVVMGAFFYFMIIRPNKKRQKEHQQLMSDLKKGSEVITTAGIMGKVAEVADNFIAVEIAPNVVIKLQRSAIVNMIPKGTLDSKAPANTSKKAKKEEKAVEHKAEEAPVQKEEPQEEVANKEEVAAPATEAKDNNG